MFSVFAQPRRSILKSSSSIIINIIVSITSQNDLCSVCSTPLCNLDIVIIIIIVSNT